LLGKLEELILISAIRAGDSATGSEIHDILCDNLGEKKSFAAVWTTLNRMTAKNYLQATFEAGGNGKKRKHFTVTGEGERELNENLVATKSLLKGSGLKPAWRMVINRAGG